MALKFFLLRSWNEVELTLYNKPNLYGFSNAVFYDWSNYHTYLLSFNQQLAKQLSYF